MMTTLLVTSSNFEETTLKLQNLMEKSEGSLKWSRAQNSCFEMAKSAVLHLDRKTMVDLEDNRARVPLPIPPLTVDGQVITIVQSYKYLGVQINTQLRWKEQIQ